MGIENLSIHDLKRALVLAERAKRMWTPLSGPQAMAFNSQAEVVGYGGAAGGGKTDLACGKAIFQHKKSLLLRREATQLTGILDRITDIIGNKDGYNGRDRIWRLPNDVQLEFGATQHPEDWKKYQGRPHDLLVFDEATNFLEAQVRSLMAWVRSVDRSVKCQTLLTFNPPSNVEGRWIIKFFAPWIDRGHPNPAKPGEIRYYAIIDGEEVEVDSPALIYRGHETIKPLSRTFIPSRVTDNPYLMNTGYMSVLQSLPEPLRSQMLNGDFNAGVEDDPWQVIPTAWVKMAQDRWEDKVPKPEMDVVGVDVARGGSDRTIIARRHGMWFDVPIVLPGAETPNGPSVAGQTVAAVRDMATICIDVIGVGSSPFDFLNQMNLDVIGVNVANHSFARDHSGRLSFKNKRSELWWKMREALDPKANNGIALPKDSALMSDLCSARWSMSGSSIYVESREEICKKIGRSPDYASAYLLALIPCAKKFLTLGDRGAPTIPEDFTRY